MINGRILWTSGLFKKLSGPASVAPLSKASGFRLSIGPTGFHRLPGDIALGGEGAAAGGRQGLLVRI